MPKTVRKGLMFDLEITFSITNNSSNEFVTSNRFVEDIIMQNNIKPM